jgi:hypothetical protein
MLLAAVLALPAHTLSHGLTRAERQLTTLLALAAGRAARCRQVIAGQEQWRIGEQKRDMAELGIVFLSGLGRFQVDMRAAAKKTDMFNKTLTGKIPFLTLDHEGLTGKTNLSQRLSQYTLRDHGIRFPWVQHQAVIS